MGGEERLSGNLLCPDSQGISTLQSWGVIAVCVDIPTVALTDCGTAGFNTRYRKSCRESWVITLVASL